MVVVVMAADPAITRGQETPVVVDTAAVGAPLSLEERIAELNSKLLQDPRNGDLYNNLGVIYAGEENWLAARDAFIAAVQSNPVEADFHRNLAQVFVHLENYDVAVQEFAAYQQLDPLGGADAFRLMGEAWRQAGQAEQAVGAFQRGLSALPASEGTERMRLILALARTHLDADQSSQARTALEEYVDEAKELRAEAETRQESVAAADPALATDPELTTDPEMAFDPESADLARAVVNNLLALYIEDAQLLADSGLSLEAAELFEKAFALAPERDELLPRVASSYLDAGDPLHAKVAVRLARKNNSETAGIWIATGQIAEAESRPRDAVDAYLKARRLAPDNRELDLAIGNLYMKLGDSAKAQQYMAAGMTATDAPPELIYNYGVSLLREKNYSQAVDALRRVVDARPDMGPAWQALALSLRMSRRYDEAVPAYQQALSFGAEAKLHFNLAYCSSRLHRTDEAVTGYREAIALDPGFSQAYHNLANTLIGAARHEEALAILDEFLTIEPDSYRILFNQGLCLYHLTRYDEALDKYELAMEQKETADVLNNMGLVYDKLGDKKEANAYYKEAKELQGGSR